MTLKEKIDNYVPDQKTVDRLSSIPVVLLASVVAGGKNTVAMELVKRGGYSRFVTNTTRAPRANEGVMEVDGIDYNFMDMETAESLVDAKEFVEVKYVHGNVYGSTMDGFIKAADGGNIAIGDVDVQGVDEYLGIKPDIHAIFLLPPSVDTWLARLAKRYGDLDEHADEIKKRFRTAYNEIKHVQADKRYILVINDDLETTVERIHDIIADKKTETSEYAEAVTEHLLDYLKSEI